MRKGYVSCDGNGMVGGHWWSCERTGSKAVEMADVIEKLEDVATHIPREFELEATFEEGEDESVGLSHYLDLVDQEGVPEDLLEAIEKAPISSAWKTALTAVIEAYIDDLDADDYTLREYED